ncbi:hypothetical protein SAMN05444413_11736 [Roseivivax marinus]|uniref:hypothetical protein n=1 Tax=Roseivivax marinus TaxID=1379903 RepID=UPI0008BDC445|nr:hypothetical protein [Roseivivax marinus]SEL82274.1 hypothetical protein SAMN05444413_11736 [Roseivivax marinus]
MTLSPHPPVDFRTDQARADLAQVIRAGAPSVASRIARLVPGASGTASTLHDIRAGGPVTEAQITPALDVLAYASALPDDDFPAFLWANAVLLTALLDGAAPADCLSEHWDAFADSYRLASDADRAALANGFARAKELRHLRADTAPAPADRLTRGREAVLAQLAPLARDVAPEVVAAARAAGDMTRPTLAAAMEHSDAALAAFAMIDICLSTDGEGNAACAWPELSAWLETCPGPVRRPLVHAVRWLYEARPDWVAAPRQENGRVPIAVIIPDV